VDDFSSFVLGEFTDPFGDEVRQSLQLHGEVAPSTWLTWASSDARRCGHRRTEPGGGCRVSTLQFVKHCARLGFAMPARDTCPVCRTAEIVCGKWTLLVIRDLADGRSRFCELERSLQGISPRTLSLRLRALAIGPATRDVVKWQFENRPHPEQGYRACLGLLNLVKRYGEARLEAACKRALAIGSPQRKSIKSILEAKLDQHPDLFPAADNPLSTRLPQHSPVRGADYFRSTPSSGDIEPCSSKPPSIH